MITRADDEQAKFLRTGNLEGLEALEARLSLQGPEHDDDADESPVACLLGDLRSRLPANLLKVIPDNELDDELDAGIMTPDLRAIGKIAGFDQYEQQAFELQLSGLSYREAIDTQPDKNSQKAFQAGYRRVRRTGRDRLAWALSPFLSDDPGESAIERARRTLGCRSEESAKPQRAAKMFFTVSQPKPKAPPVVRFPLFAAQYPREAAAGNLLQCASCRLLFNRHAKLVAHRCRHEKRPKHGW